MAAKFNRVVPCVAGRQGKMSKGRPAEESAEKNKSDVGRSIEYDMRVLDRPPRKQKPGGIYVPDKPTDKAIELMKKGKAVAFT